VTLKSCDHGVVHLYHYFSFLLNTIVLGLSLMNKTSKNHKLVLVTDLFSATIKKPIEKSYWLFVEGTRVICDYIVQLVT